MGLSLKNNSRTQGYYNTNLKLWIATTKLHASPNTFRVSLNNIIPKKSLYFVKKKEGSNSKRKKKAKKQINKTHTQKKQRVPILSCHSWFKIWTAWNIPSFSSGNRYIEEFGDDPYFISAKDQLQRTVDEKWIGAITVQDVRNYFS